MNLLEALILALVQGLTEFLPVSSSGHLALVGALMRAVGPTSGVKASVPAIVAFEQESLFYGVLLHVATMLAVGLYFRRELWALTAALGRGERARLARRVLLLLLTASLPTAALGFALRGAAAAAFESSPPLVGLGLLVTSLLLLSTLALRGGVETEEAGGAQGWLHDLGRIRLRDALVVGTAQGLAVWPGVSRSGSTIAAALWMGVPPLAAARFSLLASLPAIGGGFLLELRQLEGSPESLGPELLGFALAFGVGLLAISWLMAAVRGRRLGWYAAYTALLGLLGVSTAWWG